MSPGRAVLFRPPCWSGAALAGGKRNWSRASHFAPPEVTRDWPEVTVAPEGHAVRAEALRLFVAPQKRSGAGTKIDHGHEPSAGRAGATSVSRGLLHILGGWDHGARLC